MHNALTQLSPEEREVATLAYIEGRSNRQIAAMLGVSVSTVRRRLWRALEHLDEYLRRAGTWASSILLLFVAYMGGRAAKVGGWVNSAYADSAHKLAATAVVATVAAAGAGLVAVDLHSSTSKHQVPPIARLVPGPTKSSVNVVFSPPGSAAPSAPVTIPEKQTKLDSEGTDNQTGSVDDTDRVGTHTSGSDRGSMDDRSARGHPTKGNSLDPPHT